MKLFYSPGSCGLGPHIVMAELNMAYQLEEVNMKDKTSQSGDFLLINKQGSVPVLKMENGEYLTEGAVISQYLADTKNDGKLLAKFGTLERIRTLEMMNFIASEVHKSYTPMFHAARAYTSTETQNDVKAYYKKVLDNKFKFVSEKLGNNDFLMGKDFTIADAYMFTCFTWNNYLGLNFNDYPNLNAYMNRISERPAVMRAMKEQNLLK